MLAFSVLPPSLLLRLSPKTNPCNPPPIRLFPKAVSSTNPQLALPLRHRPSAAINGRSSKSSSVGSGFADKDETVDDMDGFMNSLSLEYESVWDTKPSWCQPWTIALTGVLAITFSWLILHSMVVTALVAFLISAWWYIFLYSYPKAYADMIAERRKKVTDGVEDTFGFKGQ